MNFGQAFLFLFALAKLADAGDEAPKLRGLKTTIDKSNYYVNSYSETLGQCTGSMCGLWGDPHVLTCDGLGFDCNAYGLFTIMKNFLWHMQGRFIQTNSVEMGKLLKWKHFPRATYATEIVIDNQQSDELPVWQFSFPEFFSKSGLPLEEEGCFINFVYSPTLVGYTAAAVDDLLACRKQCEATDGCEHFHFSTGSKHCHMAGPDAILKHKPAEWSRTVGGHVKECGHPAKYEGRGEDEVDEKAYWIGNDIKYGQKNVCPLLYYENGELQDISMKVDGDYLYGDANSDTFVQLQNRNKIKIVSKTLAGSVSEIMLEAAGKGPGALFGCHWNLFVCLPQAEQTAFETSESLGLMGSPNGNKMDDWTDVIGNVLALPSSLDQKGIGTRGKEAYAYCIENWCVSQEDSKFVYPKGASYEDVKCHNEEYTPFDEQDCFFSHLHIEEHCKDLNAVMYHQCRVECCAGNCEGIEIVIKEIEGVKLLDDENPEIIYDTPEDDPVCEGNEYLGTGETACPSASGSVVHLLHQTGDIPGGEPIIYGITYPDTQDDDHGREVSIRVANPFGGDSDVYVRYEKKVGQFANDPDCEKSLDVSPGCLSESTAISLGCIEFNGVAPFALVDIYVAGPSVSGGATVEKCCHPEDYSGVGVVKYSYKVMCECPGGTTA